MCGWSAQDHVHDPRQDCGDYPSDYGDSQESQRLRDRVDRRIKQILEALAYVNRSRRLVRDFPFASFAASRNLPPRGLDCT
jgi:hypothetical protein